jgi:S-disulfanyl-L-cysteine oxidoreductase SoxD
LGARGRRGFRSDDAQHSVGTAGIGGDKLIGGRGTLASETPVKTIESYWPYATTLFDYVKRSMPFTAPGSLRDEQVYSVVAYILAEANILPKNAALDANSLPNVAMPNRDGFVPGDRALPLRMLRSPSCPMYCRSFEVWHR